MNGIDTNAFAPMMNTALSRGTQAGAKNIAEKLDAARNAGGAKSAADMDKFAKAAEEFEAVFLSEMIKPMFEGIETSAPFGGGKGEEVFQGFMITEYGKMVAANGGVGLADNIKAKMIEMQAQVNGVDIGDVDVTDVANKAINQNTHNNSLNKNAINKTTTQHPQAGETR